MEDGTIYIILVSSFGLITFLLFLTKSKKHKMWGLIVGLLTIAIAFFGVRDYRNQNGENRPMLRLYPETRDNKNPKVKASYNNKKLNLDIAIQNVGDKDAHNIQDRFVFVEFYKDSMVKVGPVMMGNNKEMIQTPGVLEIYSALYMKEGLHSIHFDNPFTLFAYFKITYENSEGTTYKPVRLMYLLTPTGYLNVPPYWYNRIEQELKVRNIY